MFLHCKIPIRPILRSVPFALFVSVGLGIASYFLISALAFWTIDTADEEKHGPDYGSAEWQSSIDKQAEAQHTPIAVISGIIAMLNLPLYLKLIRRLPEEASSQTTR